MLRMPLDQRQRANALTIDSQSRSQVRCRQVALALSR